LVSRLEKSEPAPIEVIARVLSGKIGIVCLHGAEDAKLLSTGLAKTPRKFDLAHMQQRAHHRHRCSSHRLAQDFAINTCGSSSRFNEVETGGLAFDVRAKLGHLRKILHARSVTARNRSAWGLEQRPRAQLTSRDQREYLIVAEFRYPTGLCAHAPFHRPLPNS